MSSGTESRKVLHLCLACFYIDGYAYQENLLPRAHKRLGLDVEIIASPLNFNDEGRLYEEPVARRYDNEDGIRVDRIGYSRAPLARRLRIYRGLGRLIKQSRPDIIFVHGPQFVDALHVVRYARRNRRVRVFVDNHADYNNSARGLLGRHVLHRVVWRAVAQALDTVAVRFYGVLPSRVEFLAKEYRIPGEHVRLLPLGADDFVLDEVEAQAPHNIRDSFGLPRSSRLMVTGGKIDENKTEILNLLRAFSSVDSDWELAVFGNVVEELRPQLEELLQGARIHWLGWLSPQRTMELFHCADIVTFPGLHSVMWEQAVAVGKPLMVRAIEGTEHLDLGGNILILDSGSVSSISRALVRLDSDASLLRGLVDGAASPRRKEFRYGDIAEASIS